MALSAVLSCIEPQLLQKLLPRRRCVGPERAHRETAQCRVSNFNLLGTMAENAKLWIQSLNPAALQLLCVEVGLVVQIGWSKRFTAVGVVAAVVAFSWREVSNMVPSCSLSLDNLEKVKNKPCWLTLSTYSARKLKPPNCQSVFDVTCCMFAWSAPVHDCGPAHCSLRNERDAHSSAPLCQNSNGWCGPRFPEAIEVSCRNLRDFDGW